MPSRSSSVGPLLVLLALTAQAAAQQRKPNVVFIMADELGYYELSCMGHPHIRTPRIDRLAAEGVRFTQGLAGSALCAPTRAVLMTGKHSGHTSVRTNGGGTPLRAGEETVASVLKRAGYATGGFGKWGCGGRGSTGVPEAHGFDVFLGYYDQVHAHTYYPPYLVRNSAEVPLEGNRGGRSGETYSHYRIFDAARAFVRENKDRPFFCYLPVTPPHGMFDIPEDDPAWALYADRPWPEEARRYAAMVTMLDRQVGEMLDLLKELELDRDTLVVFSGDNGGNDYFRDREHPRGFHAPNVDPKTGVAFRGHKGRLYEGGLRIPIMARWPGRIAEGRVSDHLWYFPDVLPTLAELAGAEAPDDVDGISIVPELLGTEAAGRVQPTHPYLYWELGQQVAVRQGSWKAIRPKRDGPWELYDLARDVSESEDLAARHPDLVAKLRSFADASHAPAAPGTFADRAAHERDRAAKWGGSRPPRAGGGRRRRVARMPRRGLVARGEVKVVRASSENAGNGKVAANAVDGEPRSHWHSRWSGGVARPPHELVLDLGGRHEVTGFRYLARQDRSWNGTFKDCELAVAETPDGFGAPVLRATLKRTREAQDATCPPAQGRYVRLRVLSEINGGAWASAAEIGILGTPVRQEARRPPNVVIVFIDDMGYADIGPFGGRIPTPNLDRMAKEGMRFTDFVVPTAVCSASRAALLTGCYHRRVGISGALGPRARHGISPAEVTLAEMCKQKDYATACFGKWHLGHHPKFLPLQHGFDAYFGLPYSNDMWPLHPAYANLPPNAAKRKQGYPDLPLIEGNRVVNGKVTGEDQARLTTWYTERAVGFIAENAKRPFFLYVPHSMVHVPLFVSDKFKGKSGHGLYGDVVMEIDWSVGEILRALKEHGIDEDTLVVFTSDNGPWLSYGNHAGSSGPLREGKGTMFEGGVREPTLMRWPGRIPAGRTCAELASTIDLLPTVAALIGARLPDHPIDGKDIRPLMFGARDARSPHEAFYCYYGGGQLQAVRDRRWKLHLPHRYRTLAGRPGGKDGQPTRYEQKAIGLELFDLHADVAESKNVAADHPDVVARLQRHVEAARRDLGDRLTKRKGSGIRPAARLGPEDERLKW